MWICLWPCSNLYIFNLPKILLLILTSFNSANIFFIQHQAKVIISETYSMTFQSNSSNLENPDNHVLENLMTLLKLCRKKAARCIAVFTYVHAWVNKVIKWSLGSLLNLTERLCWKHWQLHLNYWPCFPICTKAFGF